MDSSHQTTYQHGVCPVQRVSYCYISISIPTENIFFELLSVEAVLRYSLVGHPGH